MVGRSRTSACAVSERHPHAVCPVSHLAVLTEGIEFATRRIQEVVMGVLNIALLTGAGLFLVLYLVRRRGRLRAED